MKIALTGSSSTGKTTLANALMASAKFRAHVDAFLTTDARSILRSMNHQSIDGLNLDERRSFQRGYFARKMKGEEGRDRFITDRSFVDVAAYWVLRDAVDAAPEVIAELVEPCCAEAQRYALHVYCPFDVLKFESDGYRSLDLAHHRAIDAQTRHFLNDWGLHFITLDTPVLEERAARVLDELTRMTSAQ